MWTVLLSTTSTRHCSFPKHFRCAPAQFETTRMISDLTIYMKKLLDSDWLRAVQFKCNTPVQKVQFSAKSVTPVQITHCNHSFSLSFEGQPISQSNVTKFLWVYLDEHLTWKYHINFVCKQIAKLVGILSRTGFYLSCKTKLMLYYTLMYPYITYCNSALSSTYVSNLRWLNRVMHDHEARASDLNRKLIFSFFLLFS